MWSTYENNDCIRTGLEKEKREMKTGGQELSQVSPVRYCFMRVGKTCPLEKNYCTEDPAVLRKNPLSAFEYCKMYVSKDTNFSGNASIFSSQFFREYF